MKPRLVIPCDQPSCGRPATRIRQEVTPAGTHVTYWCEEHRPVTYPTKENKP